MKAKYIVIAFTLLLITFKVDAQHYTATFEDGVKLDYDIVTNKFADSKRFNVMWEGVLLSALSIDQGGYMFGASYCIPDKFYASAHVNFLGGFTGMVDGIYFLKSWDKIRKTSFIVKSDYEGYNIKHYVIKTEIPLRWSWGPHIGYAFASASSLDTMLRFKSSAEIFAGLALFRGKFFSPLLSSGTKPVKMRRTSIFALYADFVYTPITYDATYQGNKTSGVGGRAYVSGKSSFWATRDWGFTYTGGFGFGGTSNSSILPVALPIYPVLGIGLYAGF